MAFALAVAMACLGTAAWDSARAQEPAGGATPEAKTPAAPPVIRSVRVEGNLFTDSTRVLRTFEVWPGQSFSADAVRRGQRKLAALGLFSSWKVNQVLHPEDNTVDLVVIVVERPRIAQISFEGNKQRESSDLEKKLFLKVGQTWTPTATANQVDTLRQYYRDVDNV